MNKIASILQDVSYAPEEGTITIYVKHSTEKGDLLREYTFSQDKTLEDIKTAIIDKNHKLSTKPLLLDQLLPLIGLDISEL